MDVRVYIDETEDGEEIMLCIKHGDLKIELEHIGFDALCEFSNDLSEIVGLYAIRKSKRHLRPLRQ